MVRVGGGTGREGGVGLVTVVRCGCGDSLCTVMLSDDLLVMERLACGIFTSATHLYSPPWLVRSGE